MLNYLLFNVRPQAVQQCHVPCTAAGVFDPVKTTFFCGTNQQYCRKVQMFIDSTWKHALLIPGTYTMFLVKDSQITVSF